MPKILFFAFLCLSLGMSAQTIDSAWVVSNYKKQETMIPMRDGVKLFTAIYSPKDNKEKHPFLFVRTPYSCAPYGENKFTPRLYITHWTQYLREGYILVMQDVRGSFMSEGEFMDVRPFKADKKNNETDEASDSYDAIDWLVKNVEGNNGNVGVFGISYPGFYSTMAALSNHPALKAVSPQAPVTDWFLGDDFHHNGAFALMDGFHFYSGFGRPRPKPRTTFRPGYEFKGKDNYDFFLRQGAIKNYRKLMGDSIKFWDDLMAHPNYDDWWKARDARRACKNIKPAVLVVGGTFDAEDCFGAWNLYKAIEAQNPGISNRLVMGPWFHGGWHRGEGTNLGNIRFETKTSEYFQQQIELVFFNYYLKGKGDASVIQEATVFYSGENHFRRSDSWPPKNMRNVPLYLSENMQLSLSKPKANVPPSKYTSDPRKPVPYTEDVHLDRTREYMTDDQRFAARRPDVLVFETPALDSALTLAGPVIADLKVKLSTTDADFVVKIIDVFPEDFKYAENICCKGAKPEAEMGGYQMLVRGEIFRGRFRNSFEKPEAFSPGKMETVKFSLPDIAHTFLPGHKLMIQIQSSWFPLFDRNPQQFVDIYHCDDKDFVPCEISVHHDASAASQILLPVFKP